MIKLNDKAIVWTETLDEVEPQALEQVRKMSSLPYVFKHIAVMPDVHFGKGATVGSVIAMKEAVAPTAVGVDIGCGMAAVRTNLNASDLPESLRNIRLDIEKAIPVNHFGHTTPVIETMLMLMPYGDSLFGRYKDLYFPKAAMLKDKALSQCGTLGGGNHYIELCLDEEDTVWMILHSGSRNIGKELAEYHISIAKKLAHNESLEDKDLAYFLSGTKEMQEYRHDLEWAQEYAFLNRRAMLELYKTVLLKHIPKAQFEEAVLCHHNYVSEETHFGENVLVTRKGAINAEKGRLGIIPGSMGTRSYIVEGLGNPEAFNSASHGAGRVMSRNQAKKKYSLDDLKEQMKGIEYDHTDAVLDEIPTAYKDIDKVMNNQRDLVRIKHTLRQVLSVKGK